MGRSTLILVTDDLGQMEQAKSFGQMQGWSVKVFSNAEWQRNLSDPSFRNQFGAEVPSLSYGSNPVDQGAKILPFPGTQQQQPSYSQNNQVMSDHNQKVRTINELESIAIENAIFEFNGNLTEAAKALGIGRATLYRKVKQYGIDPSSARKKRAA